MHVDGGLHAGVGLKVSGRQLLHSDCRPRVFRLLPHIVYQTESDSVHAHLEDAHPIHCLVVGLVLVAWGRAYGRARAGALEYVHWLHVSAECEKKTGVCTSNCGPWQSMYQVNLHCQTYVR